MKRRESLKDELKEHGRVPTPKEEESEGEKPTDHTNEIRELIWGRRALKQLEELKTGLAKLSGQLEVLKAFGPSNDPSEWTRQVRRKPREGEGPDSSEPGGPGGYVYEHEIPQGPEEGPKRPDVTAPNVDPAMLRRRLPVPSVKPFKRQSRAKSVKKLNELEIGLAELDGQLEVLKGFSPRKAAALSRQWNKLAEGKASPEKTASSSWTKVKEESHPHGTYSFYHDYTNPEKQHVRLTFQPKGSLEEPQMLMYRGHLRLAARKYVEHVRANG